ncbi:hypothetical protein EBU58_11760, partial [bacterium]|nr:hypothetical protein [bacterium]
MGEDRGETDPNDAGQAAGAENASPAAEAPAGSGLSPLSEPERKRLQQNFQRGEQNFNRNIDYSIEMFILCVVGDPSNVIYLQSLLGALKKKHSGKSRGGLAGVFSAGGRAKVRKLTATGKPLDAIKAGIDILKGNPSDHNCLLAMAEAAAQL